MRDKNVTDKDFKIIGKARRLKQAKDEATEEIEKYRVEREKQFKDFEGKVKEIIITRCQKSFKKY